MCFVILFGLISSAKDSLPGNAEFLTALVLPINFQQTDMNWTALLLEEELDYIPDAFSQPGKIPGLGSD